jgi:hypothetical protein
MRKSTEHSRYGSRLVPFEGPEFLDLLEYLVEDLSNSSLSFQYGIAMVHGSG